MFGIVGAVLIVLWLLSLYAVMWASDGYWSPTCGQKNAALRIAYSHDLYFEYASRNLGHTLADEIHASRIAN